MNIRGNLRKITEFGIGVTAVTTLALAGCGGGGSASSSGSTTTTVAAIAGLVSTFAGTSGLWAYTNGTATAARFDYPTYIATDGTNLYVTELNNNTIRKIVIATGVVSTFAGNGASGVADGTGTSASFNGPEGIVSDGTNLYVADTLNNNIRQVSLATAQVTTIAGNITGASGVANGTGISAQFNVPVGIAKIGNSLYVSENVSQRIRKIDLANLNLVTTFAGSTGVAGWYDAVGAAAYFDFPAGLATDGTNLYVADMNDNNIRKVEVATQIVSTVAGWHLSTGSGVADGTGSSARFYRPMGITTDGTNLYVSDTNNHTIRKIVISTGVVTTLAGTAGVSGVTDATGTNARFNLPRGILYNNSSLYVADWANYSIRKIQ